MKARICTLALAMVLAFGLNGAARAQSAVVSPSIAGAENFTPSRSIILDAMILDLDRMDEQDWQELARETRRGLWSRNPMNRMQGLQNLLHVTKMFPDQIDFSDSAERLCRLAMFDGQEGLRVMAVAALRAIDTPEGMGCLVEMWESKQPAQVRKVTNFALADYLVTGTRAVR